jgi:predicted lipid-binding transport protein (Tim44 family)
MLTNRWVLKGLMLFTLFFFLCFLIPDDASARAGSSRSSSGSRGSRTYSAPASPTSPSPTSPSRSVTSPTPTAPAPQPMQQPSMWRSIAGGVMGGLIGGMLFRSLGFGAPGDGGMGGGIGLFEIVLIGGILYFLYRFLKRRREEAAVGATYQGGQSVGTAIPPSQPAYVPSAGNASADDLQQGISHVRQMDAGFDEKVFTDACMDVFFQIQGAWANRDLATAKNVLTDEMYGILSEDARRLKSEKKINRLDNIAVRSVDISEVWQESGQDYITVRFQANLLDYTIDESTKEVLSGSRTEPVKFEEYWTFTRPVGKNAWRLSAIQQAQ